VKEKKMERERNGLSQSVGLQVYKWVKVWPALLAFFAKSNY